MGLFDDIKLKGAAYRLTEEALFAEVLREMESGIRRDGLWCKALSEVDMDEARARALYIRLRVQSLKDEITAFMAANEREVASHAAAVTRQQENQSIDDSQRRIARANVAKLREKQLADKKEAEATNFLRQQEMSLEKTLFGWTVIGPGMCVKLSSLDDVLVFAKAVDREKQVKPKAAPTSELQGTRFALEFLNAVRVLDFRRVGEHLDTHPGLVQVSNSEGQTALHLAVEERSETMARLLVEAGASPDIANNHGETPRVAARKVALIEILRIFI